METSKNQKKKKDIIAEEIRGQTPQENTLIYSGVSKKKRAAREVALFNYK